MARWSQPVEETGHGRRGVCLLARHDVGAHVAIAIPRFEPVWFRLPPAEG